jgi:3-methyladenine DNA glycosylase/8-oxoguanine DNA glycosylase
MIDPTNITDYNLTDDGLEERILFWILAAGKNGTTAAKCLDRLLKLISGPYSAPMEAVYNASNLYDLPQLMCGCGIGCYTSKARTFRELAIACLTGQLDLSDCCPDELEKIYGIGRKTSRCFILHSRKNAQYAGLDTHILKHLRAEGVEDVPKQTPSSDKQYKRLERELLKLAKAAKMSPADYDLMVWNKYSVKVR